MVACGVPVEGVLRGRQQAAPVVDLTGSRLSCSGPLTRAGHQRSCSCCRNGHPEEHGQNTVHTSRYRGGISAVAQNTPPDHGGGHHQSQGHTGRQCQLRCSMLWPATRHTLASPAPARSVHRAGTHCTRILLNGPVITT